MVRPQDEAFRYDKMVEKALRSVVQQALQEVVKDGLSDDHHFYITFHTSHPGVAIPDYLKERYPGEMTIVLQHQFYDLEVSEERFSVMLSFNNVPERLTIPLTSITIFADPSVNFALQFQPLNDDDAGDDLRFDAEEMDLDRDDQQKKKGEVISLDSFRKKQPEKDARPAKGKAKDKDKDKDKEKDKDKDTDK